MLAAPGQQPELLKDPSFAATESHVTRSEIYSSFLLCVLCRFPKGESVLLNNRNTLYDDSGWSYAYASRGGRGQNRKSGINRREWMASTFEKKPTERWRMGKMIWDICCSHKLRGREERQRGMRAIRMQTRGHSDITNKENKKLPLSRRHS